MRRFALFACVVATAAFAGERWLGNTSATDGGWANNHFTPTGNFNIGSNSLLSVQCDQDSFVMVNVPYADAGTALKLSAGQLLTSSCSTGCFWYQRNTWQPPDGGFADSGTWCDCIVTSASANWAADGGNSLCHWYSRQGNEGP